MSDAHRVLRLWLRSETGGPMIPSESIEAVAGAGLVGDHTLGRLRHVTIVFENDWNAAAATLGRTDVDPVGRRANVLVSGGGGARLVGATIRLGAVRVEVKGVTSPCPVMDRAAPGMQAALKPEGRGGVWGRIVAGGAVRVGDELTVESGAARQ
jgi:MOSC domain-containing protein YiiM